MALMNIKAVMKEPVVGDKPSMFKKKPKASTGKSSFLDKLKGK